METKRNLFKKLGNILIENGVKFLQGAFSIQPQKTTAGYLRALIASKTGIEITIFADQDYYYTDLETVKDILKHDLADEKEYEAEKFDCDDFAQTIYAIFRYVFELNSMGTARNIEMKDATTGQNVGWHRANIFLASENGIPKIYYLEPQNDYIKEITSKEITGIPGFEGKKLILGTFDF